MTDETKEGFEKIKNKWLKLAEDYLFFLQKVNKTYKGVIVTFHDIDGDDYGSLDENGNWKSKDVVKWMVEFEKSLEEGISYKVKGYARKKYVKLYEKKTNSLIIEGMLNTVNEFIQEKFKEMSQENFDEKYYRTFYSYDMYKDELIEACY